MLDKLRRLYPHCGILSELIDIDRGSYIVKVSIKVAGEIIATGLAAEDRIETAEDSARERAIATLDLESLSSSKTPSISSEKTSPPTAKSVTSIPSSVSSPQQSNRTPVESNGDRIKHSAATNVIDLKVPRNDETTANYAPPTEQKSSATITENLFVNPQPVTDEVTKERKTEDTFTQNLSEPIVVEEEETILEATSTSSVDSPVVVDFNEIKHKTDIEIKRLGWTKEDGRNFLKSHYGKRTRLHLTDEQLLEFLQHLESLPTPE